MTFTVPDPLPESTIRQLAIDITEGQVFGSWNISEHDTSILSTIFMPIAFGGLKDIPEEHLKNLQVYEYLNKAGPRSINGYPMFFSCRLIWRYDFERLIKLIEEAQQAKEAFLKGDEPS